MQIETTSQRSVDLHRKYQGKISVKSKITVDNRDVLSLVYTPGVGAVSSLVADQPDQVSRVTGKGNSVAVISDGSAVLGLGNIGPEAALPVMEGKAVLFKEFADIDAYPIVLSVHDPQGIIAAVKAIAPTFGAINLEDIAAPKCFEVETQLQDELPIPVLHDDQWGTAVVVLAGVINAAKVVGKQLKQLKVVISGAGAAGTAVSKILTAYGLREILMVDRQGIIYPGRQGDTKAKEVLAKITNPAGIQGDLTAAMVKADLFIDLSAPGIVGQEMVRSMNNDAIVFALANPVPEIMPDQAVAAGASVVATGRSDFDNQINNALAFPGVFRGALDRRVRKITVEMLIQAAEQLAAVVKQPTPDQIIPSIFDPKVVSAVSSAIKQGLRDL